MITTPPDKKINITNPDIEFELNGEDYNWIIRTANILQSPHVAIQSDGESMFITAFNATDDSAHTNAIQIGDATDDKVFKAVFLTENFRMIHGTYNIDVSSAGLACNKPALIEPDGIPKPR